MASEHGCLRVSGKERTRVTEGMNSKFGCSVNSKEFARFKRFMKVAGMFNTNRFNAKRIRVKDRCEVDIYIE